MDLNRRLLLAEDIAVVERAIMDRDFYKAYVLYELVKKKLVTPELSNRARIVKTELFDELERRKFDALEGRKETQMQISSMEQLMVTKNSAKYTELKVIGEIVTAVIALQNAIDLLHDYANDNNLLNARVSIEVGLLGSALGNINEAAKRVREGLALE